LKNIYTVFVNSSDGFEDCWEPFFKLYYKYWEDHSIPIMLNTERKVFKYKDLNIVCSQSNLGIDHRLTWSECLINALKKIETPLVLYFQEDYFIESPVKLDLINQFADLMLNSPEIKYIGLTSHGNYPPFYNYNNDSRLWVVSEKSRYRISTQSGLWDRQTLLSYLRPEENGWMFEIFGTRRSRKRKELFLTSNREIYKLSNQIINYQLTGIVKGQWLDKMPTLFEKEGIQIDFSKRGFYKEKNFISRKLETIKHLGKNKTLLFKGIRGI
jgi:hypothetical protein